MIVMKFGGTSVESRDAIAGVTSIVKRFEHQRPIVVVSAMGKTTNKLLEIAREAAQGRREQALASVDELRLDHLRTGSHWQARDPPISSVMFVLTSSGWKN